MQPIFVTILSGFLGSGKTTLINYLLKHNDGEKIAIIENEFGEVNIDKALLSSGDETQIIELSNGCVCCSIRGELTKALSELARRKEAGELEASRFIIETTGLADPAPIIQTFFVDEFLKERFVLDAVITLVDAVHIQRQLDEHRVAASQIGFAERLILTKTDLIDEKERKEVLKRLNAINKKAQIWQADNGALEKSVWIGINAFELDESLKCEEGFYQKMKFTRFSTEKINSYNDNISSFVLEGGELDFQKTDAFLEEMIETYGNDMLRYKGILCVKNRPERLIIQGVHKVAGFDWGRAWEKSEERKSLMVIIGRELPREAIKKRFLECVV